MLFKTTIFLLLDNRLYQNLDSSCLLSINFSIALIPVPLINNQNFNDSKPLEPRNGVVKPKSI